MRGGRDAFKLDFVWQGTFESFWIYEIFDLVFVSILLYNQRIYTQSFALEYGTYA